MRRYLVLHCNAGTTSVAKKADLKVYGTVWYHPDGIANILSLYNVKIKYRVISTVNMKTDLWYIMGMGLNMYLNLPRRCCTTWT